MFLGFTYNVLYVLVQQFSKFKNLCLQKNTKVCFHIPDVLINTIGKAKYTKKYAHVLFLLQEKTKEIAIPLMKTMCSNPN